MAKRKSRPQTPSGGCESSSGYEAIDTGSTPVGATIYSARQFPAGQADSLELWRLFLGTEQIGLHLPFTLDVYEATLGQVKVVFDQRSGLGRHVYLVGQPM